MVIPHPEQMHYRRACTVAGFPALNRAWTLRQNKAEETTPDVRRWPRLHQDVIETQVPGFCQPQGSRSVGGQVRTFS